MRCLLAIGMCCLLLCGCSAADIKPVTTGYAWDVQIAYDGLQMTGRLCRETMSSMTLSLLSPETVKGVCFSWKDGKIEVSRDGLSFSVTADDIPQAALGTLLVRALDKAQSLGGTPDGGRMKVEGESDDFAFVLWLDAASGQPLELSVPAADLSVMFQKAESIY